VLIFGGFAGFWGDLMSLDLADYGQGIDVTLAAFSNVRTELNDLLPVLLFHIRIV
jgi:hypothetical protein